MQINKINSLAFHGSLVLPVYKRNNIEKLTITKPYDIENIAAEDEENTLIQIKQQGNGIHQIVEQKLIPVPVATVLTAYNSAIQAPKNATIDIFNL